MTDAEVQKVIRRKVDESVESAFGVLRKELINLALLNLTFKKVSLDKFLLNFLVLCRQNKEIITKYGSIGVLGNVQD
jgi:hypothetical protein